MKEIISVILINQDKVLMHHRDNKKGIAFPDYWSLPSGRVKLSENPVTAAKREFEEETNYKLSKPLNFYPVNKFINTPAVKQTYFFKDYYDNIQIINCNEGQQMKFMNLSEISNLKKLVSGIYEIVREALNDQK